MPSAKLNLVNSNPSCEVAIIELTTAAQLFIWSLRIWASQRQQHQLAIGQIRRVYAQLNCDSAVTSFVKTMTTLASGTNQAVKVRCLCNKTINGQERQLLQTLRLLQQSQPIRAQRALSGLVRMNTSERFLNAAQVYTQQLSRANLDLGSLPRLRVVR